MIAMDTISNVETNLLLRRCDDSISLSLKRRAFHAACAGPFLVRTSFSYPVF